MAQITFTNTFANMTQIVSSMWDANFQNINSAIDQASGIAGLDVNARLNKAANKLNDGTADRSASSTPGANIIPVAGTAGDLAGWCRQVVMVNCGTSVNPNTTFYSPLIAYAVSISNTIEATSQWMAPVAMSVKLLSIGYYANPLTGTTVVTLRKNGADTALTATLAAGATALVQDSTDVVGVSPGDLLDWKIVTGSGSTPASWLRISAVLTGV
jgi:hypothetical protein